MPYCSLLLTEGDADVCLSDVMILFGDLAVVTK
jgi:hypothetical protein